MAGVPIGDSTGGSLSGILPGVPFRILPGVPFRILPGEALSRILGVPYPPSLPPGGGVNPGGWVPFFGFHCRRLFRSEPDQDGEPAAKVARAHGTKRLRRRWPSARQPPQFTASNPEPRRNLHCTQHVVLKARPLAHRGPPADHRRRSGEQDRRSIGDRLWVWSCRRKPPQDS